MKKVKTKTRKRWVAIVLALLFPGLGHIYAGRPWTGLGIYLVLGLLGVAVIALLTLLGVPLFTTMAALIPVVLALHVGQAIWAGTIAKKAPADYALRWFNLTRVYVAYAAAVILAPSNQLTRWFVVESFRGPAGSMIPTLLVGDRFFVRKIRHTPQRGDLVVFRYPPNPKTMFVKRIVALGGDTVAMKDSVLYINRTAVTRKLPGPCTYRTVGSHGGAEQVACVALAETIGSVTYSVILDMHGHGHGRLDVAEQKVLPGHVYVLGDNRDNSSDSRAWGAVPRDHILGVVESIWWSSGPDGIRWNRIGKSVR